jgi:hypothetical protein
VRERESPKKRDEKRREGGEEKEGSLSDMTRLYSSDGGGLLNFL